MTQDHTPEADCAEAQAPVAEQTERRKGSWARVESPPLANPHGFAA